MAMLIQNTVRLMQVKYNHIDRGRLNLGLFKPRV